MALTYVTASSQGAVENLVSFNSIVTSIDWGLVRNSTTGSSTLLLTGSSTGSNGRETITARNDGPGRGIYPAGISRLFLSFDTGSVVPSNATITALTLELFGSGSQTGGDSIVVQSKFDNGFTGLTTASYNNLFLNTPYSGELTTWNNTGPSNPNQYPLNSTAVSVLSTNNYLDLAVIEHDYDYLGNLPGEGTVDQFTTLHPDVRLYIRYTFPGETGYGENVNAVPSSSIAKIIGIPSTDIIRVINTPPPNPNWSVDDIQLETSKEISALINGATNAATVQPFVDPTGYKIYIPEYNNKRIRQLSSSLANDLSGTLTDIGVSSALTYFFTDMQMSDDGTKVFIKDTSANKIRQYSLSTPWDITTMSTTSLVLLDITLTAGYFHRGLHFNNDGTELYVVTNDTSPTVTKIHNWTLSTGFSLGTAGSETINDVSSTTPSTANSVIVLEDGSDIYTILSSTSVPEGYAYKNGITNADIYDSGSTGYAGEYASSNDNNNIYSLRRSGTSPAYKWTLYQYNTNL